MRWIAAIVLLAAAPSCGSRLAAGSGVVPWVNRPAPPYHVPQWPTPEPYPATAPPCTGSQLRITKVYAGAAAGSAVERFVFTNVSQATCMLGGRPGLTGTVRGRRRVLEPSRPSSGTFTGLIVPADIPPGRHGFFDWTYSDACPARATARRVTFELPGGGTVTGRHSAPLVTCGRSVVSPLGRFAPQPHRPRRVPGTVDTLVVRTSLQNLTHLREGLTLHFVITLRTPTKLAVRLDPCPSYTEALYPQTGGPARRTYRLNCSSIHAIASGRSVRYAMRFRLPRGASGLAKLAWQLDSPRQPAALAVVLVEPATSR